MCFSHIINYSLIRNLFILAFFLCRFNYAQVSLNADGLGNTYELINSVLAPGYDVVESPDCVHNDFGRHIEEVWDSDLGKYVFVFHAHVTPDNDRCIRFDRQRTEIKTYAPSPDNLKGVNGETIIYTWKFRLPEGFKSSSSFTHIHQIKAVGGDDSLPLFTLTTRKGTPDKLELIYVKDEFTSLEKKVRVNLSNFEGVWVEVEEEIKVGEQGYYSIIIKDVNTGNTLLNYNDSNISTIRASNDFIRPKWGIYRSIINPTDLRDESIWFSDFSIEESVLTNEDLQFSGFKYYPNPVDYFLTLSHENTISFIEVYNIMGQLVLKIDCSENKNDRIKVKLYNLPKSVYYVFVKTDSGEEMIKIVKR